MAIKTRCVRSERRKALQGILSGVYALAIVSDGRRYRLGAKTTGDSVVCFGRKYEKMAHVEAVAHTRFPGYVPMRINQPKPKAHKQAA